MGNMRKKRHISVSGIKRSESQFLEAKYEPGNPVIIRDTAFPYI